jgi:hypothetical protein
MKLFDEASVKSSSYRKVNEDCYSFFCRTSAPTYCRMREVFETWFERIKAVDDRFESKMIFMLASLN